MQTSGNFRHLISIGFLYNFGVALHFQHSVDHTISLPALLIPPFKKTRKLNDCSNSMMVKPLAERYAATK